MAMYTEILRGLVAENVTAILGPTVNDADIALLARFGPGVPAADAAAFCDAFERMLATYERMHPHDTATNDFRRTLARQYDAIAFRLTPPDRVKSLAVYLRAVRHRPGLARTLGWGRALALTTLGRGGRRRAHELWAVHVRRTS
jgi:hypothetical protein